MSNNPFGGSPECPECGKVDPSKLTAKANGKAIGAKEAFSFVLSEGESHTVISVECDDCGEVTARSITTIER